MGRTVQLEDLPEIVRRYVAAGSPPCEHKERAKEYYLGSQTGDRACLNCGNMFTPADEAALRAAGR
jgi:hypothetical protein